MKQLFLYDNCLNFFKDIIVFIQGYQCMDALIALMMLHKCLAHWINQKRMAPDNMPNEREV